MKAEKPARGIMLTHEFHDSKFFRVECTCGNSDDAIDFIIEIEDDLQEIQLSTDIIHKTPFWKELAPWDTYKIDNFFLYSIVNFIKGLINGFHHRLVITKEVWFNGYVKYQSTTFMTKQQTLNYAQALIDSVEYLEKVKKKKKKATK